MNICIKCGPAHGQHEASQQLICHFTVGGGNVCTCKMSTEIKEQKKKTLAVRVRREVEKFFKMSQSYTSNVNDETMSSNVNCWVLNMKLTIIMWQQHLCKQSLTSQHSSNRYMKITRSIRADQLKQPHEAGDISL